VAYFAVKLTRAGRRSTHLHHRCHVPRNAIVRTVTAHLIR
jgi:hypothetical protein